MSLVELLIAMFVTSMLLVAVTTVFTGTLRGTRAVNMRIASAADTRIALEAISRTLRVADSPSTTSGAPIPAILAGTDQTISFYALINRTGANVTTTLLPSLIEYYWDGTCLNEAVTPGHLNATGTATLWDTGRGVKCLIRTSVVPAFAYYTTSGVGPLPATAGMTSMVRQTVGSVQVTVTARDPGASSGSGVTSVSERITLDNV